MSFPYAGEWLTEDEIRAVLMRCTMRYEASVTRWQKMRAYPGGADHHRSDVADPPDAPFRLVVKESDHPCWLDEDDENCPWCSTPS